MTPESAPCTYCLAEAGQPCRRTRDRWKYDASAPTRSPHRARRRLIEAGWQVVTHHGEPVAIPLRIYGDESVEVRCPFCAKTHWHGWGPDMDWEWSDRIAHCHRGDYVIGPTKATPRKPRRAA